MITGKKLSKILYDNDPAGTCCNVNKYMEDEYDAEARHIIYLLEQGVPFSKALRNVFSFFFYDGCLTEEDAIKIETRYTLQN